MRLPKIPCLRNAALQIFDWGHVLLIEILCPQLAGRRSVLNNHIVEGGKVQAHGSLVNKGILLPEADVVHCIWKTLIHTLHTINNSLVISIVGCDICRGLDI